MSANSPEIMVRIASLVPSGTDIVRALGLGSALVGVTSCCDVPGVPVLVRPRRPKDGLTQPEIDALGAAEAEARTSPFTVDDALLRDLRPDVVLTQDTCPVCALPGDEGRRAAGAPRRFAAAAHRRGDLRRDPRGRPGLRRRRPGTGGR